jgi:GGDEF domain-containing protein
MHVVAIGFWGAFFGAVALMFGGALAAYAQSHHRVALSAGLSSLISGLFVAGYLGAFADLGPAMEARILAHVGVLTACVLGLLLLIELGRVRDPKTVRRVRWRIAAAGALALLGGWLVEPRQALEISTAVSFAGGVAGLAMGLRSALRGDRLAWIACFGVACMLVAMAGVSWIALERRGVPWLVHPVSAVAGMAYLTSIAAMLWMRYSYLIELREVLAHGPRYDPVTRMQSNAAAGHMVGLAFLRQQQHPARPLVLIAISIGNLYALENLHGRAALNHALFVCASRLRRCVPADIEMARLFEDGFLLVARDATDMERLVKLGRRLVQRLSQPVSLSTSAAAGEIEARQADWAAQVGIGLLATTAHGNPSAVVAMVRDMSRTAWSYESRIAWHDQALDRIAELPAVDTVL